MPGGKANRQRGDRMERDCVQRLLAMGIPASRVPLSGSAGGDYSGDLRVEVAGVKENIECKMRKRAWKDLYDWLPGHFALFIRTDRQEPLVVMSLDTFAVLARRIL